MLVLGKTNAIVWQNSDEINTRITKMIQKRYRKDKKRKLTKETKINKLVQNCMLERQR